MINIISEGPHTLWNVDTALGIWTLLLVPTMGFGHCSLSQLWDLDIVPCPNFGIWTLFLVPTLGFGQYMVSVDWRIEHWVHFPQPGNSTTYGVLGVLNYLMPDFVLQIPLAYTKRCVMS